MSDISSFGELTTQEAVARLKTVGPNAIEKRRTGVVAKLLKKIFLLLFALLALAVWARAFSWMQVSEVIKWINQKYISHVSEILSALTRA